MSEVPFYKNITLWLIPSLTLGLMPFFPEPHLWGKLKWMLGGGAFSGENAMHFMDWFDVLLHGTPWLFLITAIIFKVKDSLISRG
jgi:hypothetical protein